MQKAGPGRGWDALKSFFAFTQKCICYDKKKKNHRLTSRIQNGQGRERDDALISMCPPTCNQPTFHPVPYFPPLVGLNPRLALALERIYYITATCISYFNVSMSRCPVSFHPDRHPPILLLLPGAPPPKPYLPRTLHPETNTTTAFRRQHPDPPKVHNEPGSPCQPNTLIRL